MLTCKETSRLISEGLDRKLSLRQRLNLRLHLMMCGACSMYRKQIEALNELFRRRFSTPGPEDLKVGPSLSAQAKQRIAATLSRPEA